MSEPFLSEIRVFSFNFPPNGWAFCNGAIVQVQQNPLLYQLIGNTYGGTAPNSFALPNLSGSTPIHMGGDYALGAAGGKPDNLLTVNTMPQHTHTLLASKAAATSGSPAGAGLAAPIAQVGPVYTPNTDFSAKMAPGAIANAGSGGAHNNMQPYLALNFCIALQGVYPNPS
ncbi:tail Collar domain-containing protein [Capsulimonas corticalis]|uniref:Tail Collar domain-containing protein n=1 Tax=Capsulimonas corticalis TaxID=2219043 RepID=A0A402D0N2_9BACT|nr:tail fiber protein [Capsulimonas corticalis]BDI33576.1 tail Collar domain-containing protein [Capsulimonas corticalis]